MNAIVTNSEINLYPLVNFNNSLLCHEGYNRTYTTVKMPNFCKWQDQFHDLVIKTRIYIDKMLTYLKTNTNFGLTGIGQKRIYQKYTY